MIHIFDVDFTVTKKASADCFLTELLYGRIIRFSQICKFPFDLLKYKLGLLNIDFIELAVKNFKGIKKTDLENIAEVSFEKRMKKNIYTDAARLIREAQGRGEKVVFATSSLDIIIKPLERFFGIEGSLYTALEFSGGMTTGALVGKSLFGINKKEAVQTWLEKNGMRHEDVRFYSDSYTDIPLLEYCGEAIAVNPDKVLAKEAIKRDWKILLFRETGVR